MKKAEDVEAMVNTKCGAKQVENTAAAYELFKVGVRVGVAVTNAATGEVTVHELSEEGWMRRVKLVPDNTNYVILVGAGAAKAKPPNLHTRLTPSYAAITS